MKRGNVIDRQLHWYLMHMFNLSAIPTSTHIPWVLLGGLLKGDNKFYVSTAHTTEDIDEALAICDIALAAVAKE